LQSRRLSRWQSEGNRNSADAETRAAHTELRNVHVAAAGILQGNRLRAAAMYQNVAILETGSAQGKLRRGFAGVAVELNFGGAAPARRHGAERSRNGAGSRALERNFELCGLPGAEGQRRRNARRRKFVRGHAQLRDADGLATGVGERGDLRSQLPDADIRKRQQRRCDLYFLRSEICVGSVGQARAAAQKSCAREHHT